MAHSAVSSSKPPRASPSPARTVFAQLLKPWEKIKEKQPSKPVPSSEGPKKPASATEPQKPGKVSASKQTQIPLGKRKPEEKRTPPPTRTSRTPPPATKSITPLPTLKSGTAPPPTATPPSGSRGPTPSQTTSTPGGGKKREGDSVVLEKTALEQQRPVADIIKQLDPNASSQSGASATKHTFTGKEPSSKQKTQKEKAGKSKPKEKPSKEVKMKEAKPKPKEEKMEKHLREVSPSSLTPSSPTTSRWWQKLFQRSKKSYDVTTSEGSGLAKGTPSPKNRKSKKSQPVAEPEVEPEPEATMMSIHSRIENLKKHGFEGIDSADGTTCVADNTAKKVRDRSESPSPDSSTAAEREAMLGPEALPQKTQEREMVVGSQVVAEATPEPETEEVRRKPLLQGSHGGGEEGEGGAGVEDRVKKLQPFFEAKTQVRTYVTS